MIQVGFFIILSQEERTFRDPDMLDKVIEAGRASFGSFGVFSTGQLSRGTKGAFSTLSDSKNLCRTLNIELWNKNLRLQHL